MFSVKLFLCSDSASIDVRTNTISAFHITEQLMTASFPVAIPRISVVTVLNREQSQVPIQTYFPAQVAPVPTTEDNRQQ